MDAKAIDLSKENIQPLKRRRNASILGTALQDQNDLTLQHKLMQQRKQLILRSYSGDDLLREWYNCVQWAEQHFPKYGFAGNLQKRMEEFFMKFDDTEEYHQDVRYVDLWITYIKFTKNPLDVYRQIHSYGIGTECALFYLCWAEEYEKANDMKHADQIYLEGIKRKAHPIDSLESAHNDFQIRVARSILGNESHAGNENVKECRSALSTLREHGRKRNMVVSECVGNSVQHPTSGILKPLNKTPGPDWKHSNTKQLSEVKVYFDENEVQAAVPGVKEKPDSLVLERDQHITSSKVESQEGNEPCFASAKGTAPLPFTIYVEDDKEMNAKLKPQLMTTEAYAHKMSPPRPKISPIDLSYTGILKVPKQVYLQNLALHDKENLPISDHETNDKKGPTRRTITCVLQPAKGIPCVQLEEQIHGEETDETCCSEALALPLTSPTPCVSHHWQKPTSKEEQQTCSGKMDAFPFRVQHRVEQDSFVILNKKSQISTLSQKKSPALALSSIQSDNPSNEDLNQEKESKQVPLAVNAQNGWSLQDIPRSHFSTITELSEYRTRLSLGVSSGYSGGVSTEHRNSTTKLDLHTPLLHRCSQDRFCLSKHSLTLESTNPRSSQIKENIVDFYFNDFRNMPFETFKLANSKYVKVNCTSPILDDIIATKRLILGTTKYDNIDIFETGDGIIELIATETLKRKIIVQFTNTSNFWDLHIREAIKARSTQYDMVSLWPEIQKMHVFEDCCVSVCAFTPSLNVDEAVTTISYFQGENITDSMLAYLVSKMMEVIHLLHRCHIVHGSLTNSNFKISFVEQKIFMFLTDFKNALDLKLLPKEIKFRVSRSKSVCFSGLHKVQLSGYQIDCIALANCIHHLIFMLPFEVDKINGMWIIKNAFPSQYREETWMPIFTELLNSNQPDLLKLSRTLKENVTVNTELEIIRIIKGGEQ